MGCFWSDENYESCRHCNRKAVNNLIIVNECCQICYERVTRQASSGSRAGVQRHSNSVGPYYGEYKCRSCGRYWNSRLCWPKSYQMCKRCKIPVYAYKFRELHDSDLSKKEDKEHESDLCQKCKELGHYCRLTRNKGKSYKNF
ncbi:uncharacterized protein LOC111000543 isoform X2 [Pieris rapae]|uniref:uncharacterized protein LOC111000543 isoform X2 n=1 Tax=Pieris rapae TaxID=64459 RepID=UPI001E27C5A1|nr:uncharacterized protein LOC111000543 isoform X2 [Pieris rapae]